jgi:hypothetical protein
MRYVRGIVRPLVLFACTALLAAGGCVAPPIVFHDGLPAWTPGQGRPEASIGYQRIYLYNSGEYRGSAWYLTPGVRCGFGQPPLAADVGLTSVVLESDWEFAALIGAAAGVGYQSKNASVMVRPSAYFMAIIPGNDVQFAKRPGDLFWQVSLLAGNGNQTDQTHVSGGARIGKLGIGPVLLVDNSVGPVNCRLEASYMFPRADAEGRLLSVGLTFGGPAPESGDEPGLGDQQ